MKKQLENSFVPVNNTNNENTATEAKETIVRKLSQPKNFTSADMWNIQRLSVSMFQRRNCA